MIAQAKDPLAMRYPSPLVLFGIDNRGKPKGARFGKEHADLAIKAATQLQLKVLASNDPKIADLTAQLPVGRVHATGRTFGRSFAATSTTSCSQPLETGTLILQARRADRQGRLGQPLAAQRPACRKIGKLSASATSSSQIRIVGRAGTRPLSSRRTATCSHCVGATTHGSAGSCVIGFGLGCSIRGPDRQQKMGNQRKPQATQSTTKRSRQTPAPTANRCPRIGTRSISIISCWPKTTANGGRGGKPSRSRRPVICSSSGARNVRPTSR
jgi:hypothetical protein